MEKYAKSLHVGMTKNQVLLTVGSPAETDENGEVWIYLPERPAVLIPARALKLGFRNGLLDDMGYHTIVLGTRL